MVVVRRQLMMYREWRIQIGELCLLNTMAFDAAIGVILGRTQLHLHPAFIIQNGNQLFKQLRRRWRNVEDW